MDRAAAGIDAARYPEPQAVARIHLTRRAQSSQSNNLTVEEPNNAVDDLCNSSSSLVTRLGFFLYVGWIHSHPVSGRGRDIAAQHYSGAKNALNLGRRLIT